MGLGAHAFGTVPALQGLGLVVSAGAAGQINSARRNRANKFAAEKYTKSASADWGRNGTAPVLYARDGGARVPLVPRLVSSPSTKPSTYPSTCSGQALLPVIPFGICF